MSESPAQSMPPAGRAATEAIVLSEIFPPVIGGSGELLRNIYGRFTDIPVTVITEGDPSSAPPPREGTAAVVYQRMHTRQWGLMHPAGLAHHVRRAARLRTFSAGKRAIIHCARALPEGLDAWLTRGLGGPRYTCWAHGEELSCQGASRELAFLMERVFRGAGAVIANSRNTATLLDRAGAPAERVHVVYPGVDARRFQPGAVGAAKLRRRFAPNGERLLLTVGRLQRRKGHDLALQAVAGLVRRGSRLRYVIVGDGEERTRLEAMTVDLGIADQVLFVGAVPGDRLPDYFAAADIFLHPNRVDGEDIEGFGIVFLEAAAAGVPSIAGASGGVPEAVSDGVTGLLVSGTSVEELEQAIATLDGDGERRRAMGMAGRARVLAQFSWERAAREVRAIHESLSR